MNAPVDVLQQRAEAVVEKLLAADAFSRWLGIEVLSVAPGSIALRMTVRPEMVNGLGTTHGGIVYAFADSAFAFAANSGGVLSVAIDCTISYPAAVYPGDVLVARAEQREQTRKLAFCEVTVSNQRDEVVGRFRGTVFRTDRQHFPDESFGVHRASP